MRNSLGGRQRGTLICKRPFIVFTNIFEQALADLIVTGYNKNKENLKANKRAVVRMAKPIEKLTLMNDFLFSVVMRQERFCRPLLEYILGVKIRRIVYAREQETLEAGVPTAKSIRLDVYIEDDENTVYDLEVQTTDKRNLGKRSRYYQSMIDIRVLEKGQNYRRLKKSFVIFICSYDPYGRGRYIYTFRNRCDEDHEVLLDDEAIKVVINTKGSVGKIGDELKAVIRYLDTGIASTDYTRALEAEVETIKSDEKVRMQYMLLAEAYARERSMGGYVKVVSQIRDTIGEFTSRQMARYFKTSEKDCAAAIECIQAHPDWDDEQVAEEIDWQD